MKLKGVIFDMDGLLLDTEKVFQQTWKELAQERGVVLPEQFVKDITGTSGEKMYQVLEHYYQPSDGKEIAGECMKRMNEKLSLKVPLKKGALDIIKYYYEKQIPMAVASSSPKRQIEHNLFIADIRKYFKEVVSGEEVSKGKPEPDIFLLAAQKIGIAPEHCYVFEDSMNGIRAGYAAGCMPIMIPDLIAPTEEIVSLCYRLYPDLLTAMKQLQKIPG